MGKNVDPALTFEVASVRPAPPYDGRGRTVSATGIPGSPYGKDPGRFRAEHFSLSNLITMAYDIIYYRLSAPDGIDDAWFNIEAKMPIDTTKEQFYVMLQNLLAERFGIKVHWVSWQMQTYELVVAKGGPKLKEAAADPSSETDDSAPRRGEPPTPPKRARTAIPYRRPEIRRGGPLWGTKRSCAGTTRLRLRWPCFFPVNLAVQ
jgi:uncharacterized protein (TIGR03435 family)